MASNRTGLQNDKGKHKDWVEIKNVSSETVDLSGMRLIGKGDNQHKFKDGSLKPGECMLVFSDKEFKIGKDSMKIQLADGGKLLSEVEYDHLDPDQVLRRLANGERELSYQQSPGFDNDDKGVEAYYAQLEGQRKSPLLIWEVMSRGEKTSDNWIELKNVSDQPVNLAEYSLATKVVKDKEGKKDEKAKEWKLPEQTLEPGKFVAFQFVGKKADPTKAEVAFKLGDSETVVLMKQKAFVDGLCAKGTKQGTSFG